jgi:carboxypeptidase PM20D1
LNPGVKSARIIFFILLSFYFNGSARAQEAIQTSLTGSLPDKEQVPESAQLLSEYLQISSVTGNEGKAGKFLSELCVRQGLEVRIFSENQDKYNFAASIYPLELGLPNIILLNHIDVVPAGEPADWDYDPYSGIIDQGMIYGRGAIDMKGMAIMQLMALSAFKNLHQNDHLQFNVTLLSVSGEEEIGVKGAHWVVNNFLKELNPIVVYGEGGSGIYGINLKYPNIPVMTISVADKKALWLKLKVKESSSGHGSVPPLVYANKTAMRELDRILSAKPKIILNDYTRAMLHELAEIEGGLEGFVLKNITIFKPFIAGKLRKNPLILSAISNTITLTNINNPRGSANQIAQEAIADLDCRLLPGYSTERFLSEIKRKINHKNTTIEIKDQSQEAPASKINEYYLWMEKALKDVYPDCEILPVVFPAETDNNYFRNQGIPTYGINPVCMKKELLETIHNINERISIKNLEDGISVYLHLLNESNPHQLNILSQKSEFRKDSLK